MDSVVYLFASGMRTSLNTPDSWAEPLTSYLAWHRAAHVPASTLKLRSYHLRRLANSSGITPFEVTLEDLVSHIGSNRNWSAGTRRSVRTTVRSFYAWALEMDRITSNPAARLKAVTVPIGKPRPASDAAERRGLSNVDRRVRLMVKLGAKVGMRCCEIAVVATSDVLGSTDEYTLLVHGKGNKERYVPISDSLALELLSHPGGYIFPGNIDGHLSAAYVSKLLSWAMGGLATGHALRHRFGTNVLKASGGNLRVAQELLGHASVATTQIYTLVDDAELRSAALAA